jgi:hypothetical protein
MKKRLMVAILCGVFMVLPISSELQVQAMNLTGTWEVKGGKDPGVTVLKLGQSGDSISGTWQPAQGDPSEIKNCKIAGETLSFSLIHNTHHVNATAI